LDTIGNGEVNLDTLAVETGISTGDLLATLFTMELEDKVTQLPGMRYKAK